MKHPRPARCLVMKIAATALFASSVAQASISHDRGGPVTSNNQRGGVTAYWIGELTYTDAPPRDRLTEELGYTLSAHLGTMVAASEQTLAAPTYLFLTDDDPALTAGDDDLRMYLINIELSYEPVSLPVCHINRDFSVGGMVISLPEPGPSAQASIRVLDQRDRPLLMRICDSLNQPLSTLYRSSPHSHTDGTLRVVDYISRSSGAATLILMPATTYGRSYEETLRYLWAGGLFLRYHRIPSQTEIMSDPELYARSLEAFNGGGTFHIPLPTGLRIPSARLDAYPQEAREEFGDRVERLDREWTAYLSQAGLTFRGRQIPLFASGSAVEFLPRFGVNQIGSPEFWRSAYDVVRANEMILCIAARFLREHAYSSGETQPELGRCARHETVLRPR